MSDKVLWGKDVVSDVIDRSELHGWTPRKFDNRNPGQEHLVLLDKPNPNDGVKPMVLCIWCTTGKIGSYLKHPKSPKKRIPLFRGLDCATWKELDAILVNPRAHTGH
eukprot:6140793-Prymnesium_polylepis.1